MKVLIFFICLMPSLAYCQGVEPCKKCNTILISMPVLKAEAFKIVTKQLFLKNYAIAYSDADAGMISTEFLSSKGLNVVIHRYKIMVEEIDGKSVVLLKGEYDVDQGLTGKPIIVPIENKGMKGSPALKSWLIMEDFAKSFSDVQLSYEIQ